MRRRRSDRPPRRGLSPAATALIVLGLGVVAAVVGLVVGSSGPRPGGPRPTGEAPGAAAPGGALPGESQPGGDAPLAEDGAAVFRARCAPCHTLGGGSGGRDAPGGDLVEAALRRDPVWVRAMVARPDSMFRADSTARRLLDLHGLSPADVSGDDPELRALLTFLRSFDPAR